MYSIKHREHGVETLESAKRVTRDEAKNEVIGHKMPEEADIKYTSGIVFVMNENGQTVSIYHLSKR